MMTESKNLPTVYPPLTVADSPLLTRFAPSPTGFLHLGHIVSALWVWGTARINKGQVVLRIEDHDEGRARKEHIDEIIRDLIWLGFQPDQGLDSAGKIKPEHLQSNLKSKYLSVINSMIDNDDAYYCHCSRKEITERTSSLRKQELFYDGHCANLGLGPKDGIHSIRFRVSDQKVQFKDLRLGTIEQNPHDQCGDFTLVDRAGQVTYQFSCTYDDLCQNINTIIRGTDLLPATGRQIILRDKLVEYLRLESPAHIHFLHHPLLLDSKTGKKLSKRQFSESIGKLRQQGTTPAQMLAVVCKKMGWNMKFSGQAMNLEKIYEHLKSMQY